MTLNRISQENQPKPSQRLPVRVRRMIHGDGSVETSLSAFCPARARGVALEDCLHCADSAGLSIEGAGEDAFVRCTVQGVGALESGSKRSGAFRLAFGAELTPVREIMTRDVTCVTPDVSVENLASLLLERNISGVPVVDAEGCPIGIVSKTDLLRELRNQGDCELVEPLRCRVDGIEAELEPGFHAENVVRATIGDVMTPVAFSIDETETVAAAAALMAGEGVHRVPVISCDDGSVVGIVSSIDVLGWLARQHGY